MYFKSNYIFEQVSNHWIIVNDVNGEPRPKQHINEKKLKLFTY